VLLYGNRTTGDILFRDELAAMKDQHMDRLSVFHVLSREAQDVPILHGRLDEARLGTLLGGIVPAREADTVFLCGPEGMIEAATAVLASLGVDPARVHAERFTPAEGSRRGPAPTAEALAQPFATAEIVLDGRHHTVPVAEGEMVIDAALRAGLDLPYSCKGGMCCTCRARVTRGEVRMDKNYSLDAADVAAGFVLTCQAHPLTERVEVSFDAR
jgi:ring-1,2-phenylacetyl-CoA epoxidase subunit PaaE